MYVKKKMFLKLTICLHAFQSAGCFMATASSLLFSVTQMGNKQLRKASHRGAKIGREAGGKKRMGRKKRVLQINPANELVRSLHSMMTKDPG